MKEVKYKVLSHHGGDSPARLVDEAAARVGRGEVRVAVVVGGEALATCMLHRCPTLLDFLFYRFFEFPFWVYQFLLE